MKKIIATFLIGITVITGIPQPAFAMTKQNIPKEGYKDHIVVQSAPFKFDKTYFISGDIKNGDFICYSCHRDYVWGVTKEQTLWTKRQVKNIVKEITNPGMTQRQKTEAIMKWLDKNILYDDKMRDANKSGDYSDVDGFTCGQSAYEALVYNKAVCAGQGELLSLLFHEGGIASGTIISPTQNHLEVALPFCWQRYMVTSADIGCADNRPSNNDDDHFDIDYYMGYDITERFPDTRKDSEKDPLQDGFKNPDDFRSTNNHDENLIDWQTNDVLESVYMGDPYIDDYFAYKLYDEIVY